MHDAGCTLELQLRPHCLVLELLVGDGLGAENHSQLQFGMCLVILPAQEYHVAEARGVAPTTTKVEEETVATEEIAVIPATPKRRFQTH